MRPEALARTAAMNARIRDRLVPQPEPAPERRQHVDSQGTVWVGGTYTPPAEPAPERPEWVRIIERRPPYTYPVVGAVVPVRHWWSGVRPMVDSDHGSHYVLNEHEWEPADPHTPEPPTTCAICDGTGSSAGRNRTPGLIGWSPCHSCGGSGKASSEGPPSDKSRAAIESVIAETVANMEAAAAEWKVGDWFTIRPGDLPDVVDTTAGKVYQVESIGDADGPLLYFTDDAGDTNWAIDSPHFSQVTRCDPPSDPQPDADRTAAVNAFANRVAKYVTQEGDPTWSTYRCAVEAVTVAMGDAWHEVEAIAALSQEGGQR